MFLGRPGELCLIAELFEYDINVLCSGDRAVA
jgi:hypothetical protein